MGVNEPPKEKMPGDGLSQVLTLPSSHLNTRHYSIHLTSFNPHNEPIEQVALLLSHFTDEKTKAQKLFFCPDSPPASL